MESGESGDPEIVVTVVEPLAVVVVEVEVDADPGGREACHEHQERDNTDPGGDKHVLVLKHGASQTPVGLYCD